MPIQINNVPRRVVYAASGTGPYAFTFEILAAGDIAVYRDDTLLTITTDYTVSINGNGTGSVTLTATPTGATQVAIVGNRTIQRTTDFTTGGDFFANTVNAELDQQTIFAQQNAEGLSRALSAPQTDPTNIDMTMPRKADRAGKYLAFDAVTGNPIAGEGVVEVSGVYAIRNEIQTVSGISANVTTVANNNANVNTVAGSIANVNTVGTSIANVNAVGSSISNVNAVAGNATNINAVNANKTNIDTVAGNNTNINTVAGNNTNINTVATSISNVNTNATNISSINTNAANIVAIQNASANASTATTKASEAAASASAAATTYDDFDDRYLGSKASNPTLDNDGNALLTGALYWNTATNTMRVWSGSTWLDVNELDARVLADYQLMNTVQYAIDINGELKNYADVLNATTNGIITTFDNNTTNSYYKITAQMAQLIGGAIDTAGVAAKAISGGAVTLAAGSVTQPSLARSSDIGTGVYFPAASQIAVSTAGAQRLLIDGSGHHAAGADNTQTMGTAARRWSVVYAGTGTINTSDAREKTAVATLTPNEIAAAKAMSKEIGSFKFLQSVADKGDKARTHIGLTVQKAIEIMQTHNLDPFKYGFICYDAWGEVTVDHPAIEAVEDVLDEEGNVVTQGRPGQDAWTEVVQTAGNRYAFRYDQLAMFLAAGFEARLSALES